MAKVFDIKTGDDKDLAFGSSGDFELAESTRQHMEDLLDAVKGEYKNDPTVGVGIIDALNDDVVYAGNIKREIDIQFGKDGIVVSTLNIDSIEKIRIEGEYEAN